LVKLIAIDLDGTLLDKKSKISDKNIQAIKKCKDEGIKIVITSAKPSYAVNQISSILELNDLRVAYSGALILDGKGSPLYGWQIDPEISRQIIGFTRDWQKGETLGLDDGILYYEKDHPYMQMVIDSGDRIEKVKDLTNDGLLKRGYMHSLSAYESDGFEEFLNSSIDKSKARIVRGSPLSMLIFNPLADKFLAVRKILEIYNLKPKDIMAIGDSNNDIDLIDLAGVGIAMGNAVDDLKKIADYIVPDNDNDGVAYALEKLALTS